MAPTPHDGGSAVNLTGPYESERQVLDTPAVKAIYEAFRASPGAGRMQPRNHRLLLDACERAGVTLGRYDRRILAWLANWEPQTCAVVAALIARAYEAGQPQAGGAS